MSARSLSIKIFGLLFGILLFLIGVINLFWGNDPGFGLFIMILSLIYFEPINRLIFRVTSYKMHWIIKVLIGLFVLWAALGVGELFDKIDLMLSDFRGVGL